MPFAVVACKCDESTTSTEITALLNQQQIDTSLSGFQVHSVNQEQKETYKTCLQSILSAILTKKTDEPALSYGKTV